ncbi:MAG TPA: hypothetical protein VN814_24170, partial [Caulobacteraceae bacterium]|nr:hypothetical protein [Caulobacteraceae bacterium]
MDGRFLFLFVLSGCALVSSAALADPNFGGYGGACAQSQGLAPGCGGGSSNGGRTQNDAYRDRIERENQAIDQYNDGLDAIKSENYPLAEAFFRQALAIRPDYVHAQEELALANGLEAYNSQNYALALSYYQQLQQIDPHDQYVSHHIAKARATMAMTEGFAAWNRGDLTTALADYRQAYAIDPDQGYLDSINKLQNNLQSQQQ